VGPQRLLRALQAAGRALLDRGAEIGRQLGQDAPEFGAGLRMTGQPARAADPLAKEPLVNVGAVGHAVTSSSSPAPGWASV
jgi:hypothetical protein